MKEARNLLDKRSEYMPVGIAGRLERFATESEVQSTSTIARRSAAPLALAPSP